MRVEVNEGQGERKNDKDKKNRERKCHSEQERVVAKHSHFSSNKVHPILCVFLLVTSTETFTRCLT